MSNKHFLTHNTGRKRNRRELKPLKCTLYYETCADEEKAGRHPPVIAKRPNAQ